MKKRVLCLVLVCVLLFCMAPLSAIAEGVIPTIVIGGYTSSQIYLFDDEGNILEKVWMLDLNRVLNIVKGDIPDLGKANLNTLLNFRYKRNFKGDNGENGDIKNQYGRNAEPCVINAPQPGRHPSLQHRHLAALRRREQHGLYQRAQRR